MREIWLSLCVLASLALTALLCRRRRKAAISPRTFAPLPAPPPRPIAPPAPDASVTPDPGTEGLLDLPEVALVLGMAPIAVAGMVDRGEFPQPSIVLEDFYPYWTPRQVADWVALRRGVWP